MPAADRTTEPTRGPKTICIPCSQEQYERIVGDPALFRDFLDRQIVATPELFPPEIGRGYRMKDIYPSRKTGWRLRRIDLRDDQSYLIHPSFLMPYLSGRAEDVQAPLVCFHSPFPSGHSMEMGVVGRLPFGPTEAVEKRRPPPPSPTRPHPEQSP